MTEAAITDPPEVPSGKTIVLTQAGAKQLRKAILQRTVKTASEVTGLRLDIRIDEFSTTLTLKGNVEGALPHAFQVLPRFNESTGDVDGWKVRFGTLVYEGAQQEITIDGNDLSADPDENVLDGDPSGTIWLAMGLNDDNPYLAEGTGTEVVYLAAEEPTPENTESLRWIQLAAMVNGVVGQAVATSLEGERRGDRGEVDNHRFWAK